MDSGAIADGRTRRLSTAIIKSEVCVELYYQLCSNKKINWPGYQGPAWFPSKDFWPAAIDAFRYTGIPVDMSLVYLTKQERHGIM